MSDIIENENTTASVVLVVEDGSCVTGANTYISLEEAIEYQTKRNRTDWLELDESAQIATIIKGTQYVDNIYNWKGRRKFAEQELNFPRVMLRDSDGFEVVGIPKRLKTAVMEAAYYGYLGELFTTHDENGAIKRKKVDVLEVEYFSSSESEIDYISKYAALDAILKGLYFPKDWKGSINTHVCWRCM